MKKISILLVLLFPLFLNAKDPVRLSEPVFANDSLEVFGELFDYEKSAVQIASLMQTPEENLGKQLLVEAPVTKVCQKKGCFFISQLDSQVVRISFKNYGFFIPTDSTAKTVKMQAMLTKVKVPEDKAAHFEKDLKLKEGSFKTGETYELVATGVMIPKV